MGKRIMIVDDMAFMRLKLKSILQGAGHEVVAEASNGREALEKLEGANPQVITLDITMPDMDGLTALKEIKKVRPSVHVVMVTAMGMESTVLEAVANGARDFIVKPFQDEKVISAISKIP